MSLNSLMMRFMCWKSDRKRDKGLKQPESITAVKNISYGPHRKQKLDVYRPKDAGERRLPVIVSVHGGGWVYGDKELYSHYCMDLAQRGFGVVNFTYRLSPEHKFPCHLEDTALAFDWVVRHGKEYGLDTEHIFAVGDSAGGHILALYCTLCGDPRYAASYPFRVPGGGTPKAVALNCGVYELVSMDDGTSDTLTLMKDVFGHRPTREELAHISPALHITPAFPPSYIMTANEDFLKDQPPFLIKALDENGVSYEYRCYGDARTPLGHVFHLRIRTPQAVECNDIQCAWFRKFLES